MTEIMMHNLSCPNFLVIFYLAILLTIVQVTASHLISKSRKLVLKTKICDESNDLAPDFPKSFIDSEEWRQRLIGALMNDDFDDIPCNGVYYIGGLLDAKANFVAAQDSARLKLPNILDIQDTSGYSAIFEEFIIPKKIFKGRLQSPASDQHLQSLFGPFDAEYFSLNKNNGTHDSSIFERLTNTDALKSLPLIPKIAANNYLWKASKLKSSLSFYGDSLNVLTHWPAVEVLRHGMPSPLQACPAYLNSVVWTTTHSIKIRLFHRRSASFFQHQFGFETPEKNISLHYEIFTSDGFTEHSGLDTPQFPKFKEFELKPGEYVFIPNNYIASYQFVSSEIPSKNMNTEQHLDEDGEIVFEAEKGDDSKPKTNPETFLLKACIVDASNLNSFLDSIAWYAKGSELYHHLYNLFTRDIDFSMIRIPVDSSLDQLLHAKVGTSDQSSQDTLDAAAASEVATLNDRKDRRKRQSSKTSGLKDWQEVGKWNMLISSLSLPKPAIPFIKSIGRDNVTLQWKSLFDPKENDRTTFGFNISYCKHIQGNNNLTDDSLSVSEQNDGSGCLYFETYKTLEKVVPGVKQVAKLQTSVEYINADSGKSNKYTLTVPNLSHSSQYRFSVAIIYNQFLSTWSEYTSLVTTVALSTPTDIPCLNKKTLSQNENINKEEFGRNCLYANPADQKTNLHFIKPYDDGGLSIDGYHVYARVDDSHSEVMLSSGWEWMGFYLSKFISLATYEGIEVQTIGVNNLHVDTRYSFKVQASNSIGVGPLSDASNSVVTLRRPSGSYTKYGRSHHMYDSHSPGVREAGTTYLVIDDILETLGIYHYDSSKIKNYEIWRCHWSPRIYKVEAQFVWSDPPHADGEIINAAYIRGNIAVVQRGHISLASKVVALQQVGAVAVLIIDSDGTCESFSQNCLPGSNKTLGQGFARLDVPSIWMDVRIPVVFGLKSIGELLENGMASKTISPHGRDEL